MSKNKANELTKIETEGSGLEVFNPEELTGYAFVRDFKFPDDGKQLRGSYVGPGAPIEFADANTGEVKTLKTWRVKAPNGKIEWRVIGGAGLDKQLQPLTAGNKVAIAYLGKKDIGRGHMMHDYAVGVSA